MAFPGTGKIWMNGKLVDWRDATIHIGSHVIHYGSGVFEGARCYSTPKGSACFRLDAHMRRLQESAKIYRMEYSLDLAGWMGAVLDTIRANEMKACYIRPLVYRGYETLGVNPLGNPVDAAIMVWDWGAYLGQDALEDGVDVKVSSWTRLAPNTLPAMAKSTANYANSALIKMEAMADGYAEGIALDVNGFVSEGSGENLFIVHHDKLITAPLGNSVLPGITRDSILQIARDLNIPILEHMIPREMLYIADEAFFTGTAAEVTAIRSVDKISVGKGAIGPVTKAIQKEFYAIVHGEKSDRHNWFTPVPVRTKQPVSV